MCANFSGLASMNGRRRAQREIGRITLYRTVRKVGKAEFGAQGGTRWRAPSRDPPGLFWQLPGRRQEALSPDDRRSRPRGSRPSPASPATEFFGPELPLSVGSFCGRFTVELTPTRKV